MDAREAREHIEMVDRILRKAERRPVRPWAALLVWLGFAAALIDAGQQLSHDGRGGGWVITLGAAVMLLGYVYAVLTAIRARRIASRMSRDEVQKGQMIGAVWLSIFITSFAQPHLLTGWSGAVIWSIGAAIQMMVIGFSGDRRALIASGIVLASLLVANFVPTLPTGYVLAGGFLLGYFAPGLMYLADGDDDCDPRG